MKIKIYLQSALCFLALGQIGVCQAADKYKTFSDEITCGKTKVTIQSTCEKSDDSMSLNTCKVQKLKTETTGEAKNTTLPELNQDDINSIKGQDGSVSDFFVIQMGCAQVENTHYAIFYYSTGGGSGPYSEFLTAYNENGKLLENKKFPLRGKSLEDFMEKMTKVHSIMPE